MTPKKGDITGEVAVPVQILTEIAADVATTKTKVENIEERLGKGDEKFQKLPCLLGGQCPSWLQSPVASLSAGGVGGAGILYFILEMMQKHSN